MQGEGFASPLNCHFGRGHYGSLFPDVDKAFGSRGSFFAVDPAATAAAAAAADEEPAPKEAEEATGNAAKKPKKRKKLGAQVRRDHN